MFFTSSGFLLHTMFCFRPDTIDVEEPTPAIPKQLVHAQGPPDWLQSFVDSEDYLSNCPSTCFSVKVDQKFLERPPKSHRRRYFCTECPEGGAICIERIIEQHLKHRVLKVRKMTGVESPLVKVRDIEHLLNISYVLRLSSANNDIAYVKLKTRRQSLWGSGSEQVICFECLRLADSDDSHKYKYCSIKCAYANVVNDMYPISTCSAQALHQPTGFTRSKSWYCGTTSIRHRSEQIIPPRSESPGPEKSAFASPSISDSVPSPHTSCRSRFLKYLRFSSSKRQISSKESSFKNPFRQDENISPSTPSGQEGKESSWVKVQTSPGKAPEGDQRESTPDQAQTSRRPPRQTLAEKREPQDNEMVKEGSPKAKSKTKSPSNDFSPLATLQHPDKSWSPESTPSATPVSRRVSGLDVRSGPVTTIYWQTKQGSDADEEVVQGKWGSVRSRVLDSSGRGYATYRFENKSEQCPTETVEVFVSGFEPTAPQATTASEEFVVFSRPCEAIEAHAPVLDSNRGISGNPHIHHKENLMTRRNTLYEMRQHWGAEEQGKHGF